MKTGQGLLSVTVQRTSFRICETSISRETVKSLLNRVGKRQAFSNHCAYTIKHFQGYCILRLFFFSSCLEKVDKEKRWEKRRMRKTLASVLHSCVIMQTTHADFDDLKSVFQCACGPKYMLLDIWHYESRAGNRK